MAISAPTSTSLTATGSAYNRKDPKDAMTVFQFSGTYGTVTGVFEGCLEVGGDSGDNWFPLAAVSYETGLIVTGTISPSDNAEVAYKVPSDGLTAVRFRVTAIASGTITVSARTLPFAGSPFLSVAQTGTNNAGLQVYTGGLRMGDSSTLRFGDSDDITMAWDGTDFDILQLTANSSMKWGVDGAGIDQVWYGDTASTNMTWDQSADSLIFNGAARIVWTGTTGQPEMHLTDNLADALSIEISGSTDLMVFTTTDNAESVSPIGLRTRSSTAVAITGATTLKLSDSGGIFTVSQGAAYDIDLPSPTSGPGCSYFFSLTAPAANNVTITVAGAAATFVGSVITEGQIVVATGSTLTFASGVCVLGDSIEIRSIATNLYHVIAVSSILNGITIA